MPRRFTIATLRLRCKQRTDQENSSHIADSEWNALISEAYGDLFSVVSSTGLRYFESSEDITTDGGESYDEPTSHLSTISIERVFADGTRYELSEAMPQEQPFWGGTTGDARFYALVDDQLFLYPKPPSGQTYRWKYIQQPTDYSSAVDADLVDVVTPDGESFLIWSVAVRALAKSESDVQVAMMEREAARARLLEWAQLRAFTQPRRQVVVDEYMGTSVDPADWWNRG